MQASDNALRLIKRFEGLATKAYKCPAGVLTIGYGHTKDVKEGDVITFEQADTLLKSDLKSYSIQLSNILIANKVSVNQNQFDALISFCFNLGIGSFANSTLLKKLKAQDYSAAAREFGKWVYVGQIKLNGLIKRREAEQELFLQEVEK